MTASSRRVLWQTLALFFWLSLAASGSLAFYSLPASLLGLSVLGILYFFWRKGVRDGEAQKRRLDGLHAERLALDAGGATLYLSLDDAVQGPMYPSTVRDMWAAGEITGMALVCLVGSNQWQPLENLKGALFPPAAQTPAAIHQIVVSKRFGCLGAIGLCMVLAGMGMMIVGFLIPLLLPVAAVMIVAGLLCVLIS